jgi:hypothetical protein
VILTVICGEPDLPAATVDWQLAGLGRDRKRGVIDMDNPADTLDQANEEVLTYTASNEALEAAAGIEGGPAD